MPFHPPAIPRDRALWSDWHWQLAHTLGAEALGLDAARFPFPCRITPYYASLANWQNPEDPIRRQCCPDERELLPERNSDLGPDPFGECGPAALAPGIKQRFPDRILAMLSTACSTYCRHCTRRGLLAQARCADLPTLLSLLDARPGVREVLLSGGDPLLLEDAALLRWVDALAARTQLDAIRLCTRTPAVLPMRWTEPLVDALARSKRLWVQTQFNHPRELTPEAIAAVDRLVERGIPVSNQSVLLRGINDDPAVMTELCARLQRHRIRPYYLFECDPIAGIDHFRTPPEAAPRLREHLLSHLGGLACPRLVRDIPGARHKCDAT